MKVWRLQAAENSRALHCVREGDYRRVSELADQPVDVNSWEPLRVQYIRDGSAGSEPSDLVMLGVEPAFTARAVESLADILFPAGQVLPLRSDDGEFYLWNVTTFVDALDEESSALHRFSSGRIMHVERWSFRPDSLGHHAAFKVPQLKRAHTFVTQRFLDRILEEKLLGFAPDLLWLNPAQREAV